MGLHCLVPVLNSQYNTASHRLPIENQRDKEQQTLLKSIISHSLGTTCHRHNIEQFDPWQVVPRQEIAPLFQQCLLLSVALVASGKPGVLLGNIIMNFANANFVSFCVFICESLQCIFFFYDKSESSSGTKLYNTLLYIIFSWPRNLI